MNNPIELSESESRFLNEYFQNEFPRFDFSRKKVLFVTGSAGTRLGTKDDFFSSIEEWSKKNQRVACGVIPLTEEEHFEFGFDAIIAYWVKVMIDPNQRKRLLQMAKS